MKESTREKKYKRSVIGHLKIKTETINNSNQLLKA